MGNPLFGTFHPKCTFRISFIAAISFKESKAYRVNKSATYLFDLKDAEKHIEASFQKRFLKTQQAVAKRKPTREKK